MPRQPRAQSPTNYYHVIVRGNNRERVFSEYSDKLYLLGLIKEQANNDAIEVAGYCIMNNHLHMVIRSDFPNLPKAMRNINAQYAMTFNKKRNRIGHVFQERYKSKPIVELNQLLCTVRYVHNNPVEANLVKYPSEYPWSSYNEYLSTNTRKNVLVNEDQRRFILRFYGGTDGFSAFHTKRDNEKYLDLDENVQLYQMKTAQDVVSKYLADNHITQRAVCKTQSTNGAISSANDHTYRYAGYPVSTLLTPQEINQLIELLLKQSKLSHRKIAQLLGVSNSRVHRISSAQS